MNGKARAGARTASTMRRPAFARAARALAAGGMAAGGLIAAATPAFAADECGVAVSGRVTCTSAGNPYAAGITYTSVGDLTVATNADTSVTNTLSLTSTGGAPTVASAGTISTNANGAAGIRATGTGNTSVTAASVTTAGINSPGIVAISSGGTASVTSTSTIVKATGGIGILVTAPGAVTISSGTVSSVDQPAISATSRNGATSVAITGNTTAGAVSDTAVRIGAGTTISVTIAAGATVSGTNGLTLSSITGATIANAGTLTGTNGYAILSNQGTSTLTNTGTITGRLDTGGPNNNIANTRFINNGTFNVTGFSLFGGTGSLTNGGTVQYLAAAPAAVSFFGLASFANSGALSLANGRAGDVLTLPGTFTGSGGSSLALDAQLGTANGAADKLVIGGAATGSTSVTLVNTGGAALLNSGTVLIQAGAGSSAGAFVLAPGSTTSGFAQYALVYSAAANSYSLIATPSIAAYTPLKLIEGARNIAYRTADIWSAHMRSLRDAPGVGGRLWGQIYGSNDFRSAHATTTVFGQTAVQNLSYHQDGFGGQLGLDVIQASGEGGVTVGVTGGYTSSHQDFSGSPTEASYRVANGGAYVSFKAGPFFVNGLAKYDRYWLRLHNSAIGLGVRTHGDSYGATGEAGIRTEGGGIWFEPLVTVSYVRTELNDFSAFASSFDFRNADGLRGKAGVRFGTALDLGGTTLNAYAGGNAVKEFRGRDDLVFANNGTSLTFRASRIPLYGEGFAGVTIGGPSGVSGFIEGFGDYGKVGALRGGGGRAGLRIPL